ncbi:MAG TPA: cellulose synthase operon protein YhjQ/BcsQ [Pirellulales bacterium]|nr:cellulose synthase operon protein YhjQ/BcsQ [Pirellulales bacterium]
MSTLNQAFIKVYQRNSVAPQPHVAFPVPAETPPVRKRRQIVWPETCESLLAAAGEGLAALAAALVDFSLIGPGTLLVTGFRRGEGRTTLLLALARHWSRQGRKALLVDADCQRPQLAERLGVKVDAGWDDALSGRVSLDQALVETADGTALLAPRGPVAAEHLRHGGVRPPLPRDPLVRRFDCVCFDAGPLAIGAGRIAERLLGSESALDAAVVVRDARHTPPLESEALARRLAQAGVGHWHLVENFM